MWHIARCPVPDLIHQEDGTIVAPLDKAFKLTTLEQAVLVKVIHPDGRIEFLRPKKESA